MSTKYDTFVEALETLCVGHGVVLVPTGGYITVIDADAPDADLVGDILDDGTVDDGARS